MSLVFDLSHTSHCRAQTGVQRVCRQLYAALAATGAAPLPVVFDRYANRWRGPDSTERALLSPRVADKPGQRRGETWTLGQRVRSWLKLGAEPDWAAWRGTTLLAPEIFTPRVFGAYRQLRTRLGGAAGAIFYDAVVLRHPELSPAHSVQRFPAYLRELAEFDGIAAISCASRDELLEHFARLGLSDHPPVVAIPLGVEIPSTAPYPPAPPAVDPRGPLVLSVGTLEGRKNHLALVEAAETLWLEGRRFRLSLVGLHRPETAGPALRRAAELQAAGRPLELPGPLPDAVLETHFAECRFTVYPSLYEGFGLPVAESLVRGRVCVCGPGGALKEVAQGGGCLQVDEPNPAQLAGAMRRLLQDDIFFTHLGTEAMQRRFPTWTDYGRQIASWLETLRPRLTAIHP